MHLADAFIQSDLHSGYTFSLVHVFPGTRTHNLLRSWRNALPLSHTGTHYIVYKPKTWSFGSKPTSWNFLNDISKEKQSSRSSADFLNHSFRSTGKWHQIGRELK